MSPAQNTYRFPDASTCSQANRNAAFHPGTPEGPPCAEVDGVLVFAYLDHQGGAFRVSVHLDSAAQRLVRPDGTVPLRVVVEDTVVFDDSEKGVGLPVALLGGSLNSAGESRGVRPGRPSPTGMSAERPLHGRPLHGPERRRD